MVTKLLKLRYVEADQMRNVLNQFTSRDSDFQSFPPDSLIISDLGLNMRRLEKLVDQLDQPGGSEEIHIVPVQYAGAQELAQKLTEIFQAQAPTQRGGSPPALGVAEPLRQPGQPVGVPPAPWAARPPGVPPTAGGATGGRVSADLFSGEVKITADKNTNSLVVIASQADYRNLVKVVERLDIRRRQVFVEAVIMEVNLDNDLEVGVSAHGGTVINDVSFRGAKGPAPLVIGSELGRLSPLGGGAGLAGPSRFL